MGLTARVSSAKFVKFGIIASVALQMKKSAASIRSRLFLSSFEIGSSRILIFLGFSPVAVSSSTAAERSYFLFFL